MRILILLIFLLNLNIGFAQIYEDYLGAGHNIGVKTTASDELGVDSSSHTLTGTQIKPDLIGASRFLSQAALGASYEDIVYVSEVGIDVWLDEQFGLPVTPFATKYQEIYDDIHQMINKEDHRNEFLSFVFYDCVIKDSDVLRQKVAFALSQILVISPYETPLNAHSDSNAKYYDFLYKGTFGNYKDILTNVSLSPTMGIYLSHLRNQRGDVVSKTYPDENYAREIMQLFSIGLEMLNTDGTPVIGSDGNTIPTYDITNVAELAKVFTGFAAPEQRDGTPNNNFFYSGDFNRAVPMKMFEEYHAPGEKNILPGVTIPAGQSGSEDVRQSIDVLFNHPNVGPFLSTRLIQHLVKSNPTRAYVKRVATVFNDNGKGVRGDLKEVVRAILLDPEARDCAWIDHPSNGKLIQPVERYTMLFKAFDLSTPSGRIWMNDESEIGRHTGQAFLASPSVFNFFTPFYAEDKFVAPNNLVSPEFQILNSVTTITYINDIEETIKYRPFRNRSKAGDSGGNLAYNNDDEPTLDFSDELNIYNTQGVDALIDRLDLILCRGQLSAGTKTIIKETIQGNLDNVNNYDSTDVLHDILYYIMLSPDYIIQK